MKLNKDLILNLLEEVMDPEIPVLSLVDLGVITDITIKEDGFVKVNMTPTFVGCPAMEHMKNEVSEKLAENGIANHEVVITFDKQWNSDMISEKGRQSLKKFGLTPPPKHGNLIEDLDILEHAECPNCGSTHTELKSPFGPTLCRSLHYCLDCGEGFEQFKPI
jgi:ring-1,2-phenylacetyl-CoA epoxidase subunit PaaD